MTESAGCVPLYLELLIPSGYPDDPPQPDLSNLNNAPYAPAVREQAVTRLTAEVRAVASLTYRHLAMHTKSTL